MCLRFIGVITRISPSPLLVAEYCSPILLSHSLFIQLPVEGHLGCFHILVIERNVDMDVHVQIVMGRPVFNSLGYILKSGIARSRGNSVLIFGEGTELSLYIPVLIFITHSTSLKDSF